MLPIQSIVIFAIGFVFFLIFMIFYSKSKNYDSLFQGLDEKEYPLKECYSIGYAILETINYKYRSKKDRNTKLQLEILYGKKYAEYYLRVIYAQKTTYAVLLVLLSFPLFGLTREISILILMILMGGLAFYYYGEAAQRKIDARSSAMMTDFAEAISKMSLLVNAGMVLREAWAEVAYAAEGVLYDEMRITYDGMRNGESDETAIFKFGIRCVMPEMKKFASTIVQALQKGGGDMTILLMDQSKEVWNERKQSVKRDGERASGKLMIPMFLMFSGILIMIVIPVFSNLNF